MTLTSMLLSALLLLGSANALAADAPTTSIQPLKNSV